MEDRINEATNPNPPMAVLSSAFKLDITRKDIRTLVGLEWLNDEIINFYMNMLVDRAEKSEGALPKVRRSSPVKNLKQKTIRIGRSRENQGNKHTLFLTRASL